MRRAYSFRSLCALALAVAVLLLLALPGLAGEEWCEYDPVVAVITPAGNVVSVFVTNAAQGIEHLPALELASITYTVKPAGDGLGTHVRIEVVVPQDVFDDEFPTRALASTGPLKTGTHLASDEGTSGKPMRLYFRLDVP